MIDHYGQRRKLQSLYTKYLNINCPFALSEPDRIYPHKQQRVNTQKSKGFYSCCQLFFLNKFKVRKTILIAFFVKVTRTEQKQKKKISLGLKKKLITTTIGN